MKGTPLMSALPGITIEGVDWPSRGRGSNDDW